MAPDPQVDILTRIIQRIDLAPLKWYKYKKSQIRNMLNLDEFISDQTPEAITRNLDKDPDPQPGYYKPDYPKGWWAPDRQMRSAVNTNKC